VSSIESSFYGLIVGIFLYYFFVKRKHRKKLVFIVFLITLIPSLWRTYLYASDARGLILIAGIESSNLSFNPYQLDEDAIFLTPIASEWIFINIPSLYSSCGYYSRKLNKCDLPLVNYIGSILSNNGSSEVADRLYRILDELIKRGEPLNALYHGMAPLHLAIISNEPVYALALLSGGASLNQKVSKPGKSEDGFTALELLEHREKQVGKEYTELRNLFQRQ
jgi:hypothetical protein